MARVFGVMLVGCGYIGQEHLSAICCQDNIRLVAVVDTKLLQDVPALHRLYTFGIYRAIPEAIKNHITKIRTALQA